MNKQIKMVGFDLDGTLLNSKKEISDYTKRVMTEAIAQGAVLLPATGRPLVGVPKEVREFPGIKYAVTANGARVVDLETEEVVIESTVPLETAFLILDIFDEYDCHEEIFIEGKGYANARCMERVHDYFESDSHAEYTLRTRIPVENVREKAAAENKPLEKVQAFFRTEEEFWEVKKRLNQIEGVVATNAVEKNWEVNREGTDKGNALIKLGELLGIKREEIMACGDAMNDFEMVKKVGFGVVMENGQDELKVIADYISSSNDEDGVARAIERFVLK